MAAQAINVSGCSTVSFCKMMDGVARRSESSDGNDQTAGTVHSLRISNVQKYEPHRTRHFSINLHFPLNHSYFARPKLPIFGIYNFHFCWIFLVTSVLLAEKGALAEGEHPEHQVEDAEGEEDDAMAKNDCHDKHQHKHHCNFTQIKYSDKKFIQKN